MVSVIRAAPSREGWTREIAELGIGAPLKEALREPGPWTIGMTAFGEILPYHDNRMSPRSERQADKWGLPVLAMDCEISDNEKKMRERHDERRRGNARGRRA